MQHPLLGLEGGKFDDAVALWKKQAAADPKAALADETALDLFGYEMMSRDLPDAVKLLHLISAAFPASSNAHDSYAEALMRANEKPTAIAEYEASIKTLDADPRIPAAKKPERKAHAEEQLVSLRKR